MQSRAYDTDHYFRNRLVRTIKTDTLYKFIEKKQSDGLANATINRCLALVKRAMNIARRDGKLAAVPYFPMLKEDNVRTGFINRSDFIRLRDAVPEHLRPLVTFLYFTGCRVGAALSIFCLDLGSLMAVTDRRKSAFSRSARWPF